MGNEVVAKHSRLYMELGGRETIHRVHRILYGKVYAHPWLKQFFVMTSREHQENQQSDFMSTVLGGPKIFSGRVPKDAHPHLFITDEVFDIRHQMLRESLEEAGIPEDLATLWLQRDENFRKVLVKKSVEECCGRYRNEEIIAPEKPVSTT